MMSAAKMKSGIARSENLLTPSTIRWGMTMEGIGGPNPSKVTIVPAMLARKIGAPMTRARSATVARTATCIRRGLRRVRIGAHDLERRKRVGHRAHEEFGEGDEHQDRADEHRKKEKSAGNGQGGPHLSRTEAEG